MAYKEVSVKQPLLLTILPYISIIIFFAFWEGVVRTGIIPNTLLASPSQVFAAFIDKLSNPNPDGAVMATHAWTSIQEAFIGYVLSLVVGIPLGLAMGWFNVVEGLFRPIFELIRPIPPIAWIPLTVFWFGIGELSKVFIIFIGTFVPCLLNAYNGVRLVDPDLYDVIRVLGGSRRDEIFHVCFPASFPAVFAGLQISLSSAWTCVLAAELMNSRDGMGFLIKRGMDTHQPTLVLGGMVLIAAAAYGTSLLVTLLEGKLCPWKRTIENL